jgi:MFS family permease
MCGLQGPHFVVVRNKESTMPAPQIRMDDLPLGRFHYRIAALTFGAHLTDGYVLGIIGFALISLKVQLTLTPLQEGLLGGAALFGLFLGSLVLGWISDYVGRQKIFTFSFVLITLASLLQFYAQTAEQLFFLRVLVGIGLGGDYSVGHTMLAEIAPRRHRGVLLGAFSVVWTVGYIIASLVGHVFAETSPDIWRWLLASAALPAGVITLLRWGTPESPRWLMRQGRISEAWKVVHRHLGPNVLLGDEMAVSTSRHIRTLFSAAYWRRTAFNSLFFVCLVIPYFVIYTWLPSIMQSVGLAHSLRATLLLNLLLVVGAVAGLVLTQYCSRRGLLISGFAILSFCLLTMAFIPAGKTACILTLFVIFTATISAVSNLVGILPAESFPTDIRSLGVGFATAMSRLGSAISTGLLPLTLASWGLQNTMLMLAGVLLLGLVVSVLWAPETKDLTLVAASGNKEKLPEIPHEHSLGV